MAVTAAGCCLPQQMATVTDRDPLSMWSWTHGQTPEKVRHRELGRHVVITDRDELELVSAELAVFLLAVLEPGLEAAKTRKSRKGGWWSVPGATRHRDERGACMGRCADVQLRGRRGWATTHHPWGVHLTLPVQPHGWNSGRRPRLQWVLSKGDSA